MAELIVHLLMAASFFLLVASVVIGRRLTDRAQVAAEEAAAGHDPRTCAWCARYRHPSRRAARTLLARIPRQPQGGDR